MQQSPAPRRGFTLVELLVVIAVIAVLAGMLMPAMGLMRESSLATRCTSQLRQVGAAYQAYANDARGRLPPAADGAVTVGNTTTITWGEALAPYLEGTGDGSATRTLVPQGKVTTSLAKVLHCPRYEGAATAAGAWYAGGYAPNRRPFFETAPTAQIDGSVGAVTTVRLNLVTLASQRLLVGDSLGTTSLDTTTVTWSQAALGDADQASGTLRFTGADQASGNGLHPVGERAYWTQEFIVRHKRKGNAVFFDGHVQAISTSQALTAITSPSNVQ
jgi:prepilin-type N-terminal cleavage/methylation domain-containing protein/prepilin-type processing-associated H-X9-DG protein